MTRITSTCDFCLRDDQPCTVYVEGVYCDLCQSMARREERADDTALVSAIWASLLTFGVLFWAAVVYFAVGLLS